MEKTLSILFLGKSDENFSSIEKNVIDLDRKKRYNFPDNIKPPDVIKESIDGYYCDAWIIIGDVKPTLLLKNLISEVDIIILIFNLTEPSTLDFLIDGWGPIIKKAIEIDKSKIILVGTYSLEIPKKKIEINKINFKGNFKYTQYFEEEINENEDFKYTEYFEEEKENLYTFLKSQLKPKTSEKDQQETKDTNQGEANNDSFDDDVQNNNNSNYNKKDEEKNENDSFSEDIEEKTNIIKDQKGRGKRNKNKNKKKKKNQRLRVKFVKMDESDDEYSESDNSIEEDDNFREDSLVQKDEEIKDKENLISNEEENDIKENKQDINKETKDNYSSSFDQIKNKLTKENPKLPETKENLVQKDQSSEIVIEDINQNKDRSKEMQINEKDAFKISENTNQKSNPIPKGIPIIEDNNLTNDSLPKKDEEIKNKTNSTDKKEEIDIKENNYDIIKENRDISKENNKKNENKHDDFNNEIDINDKSFSLDEKQMNESNKNDAKTEEQQKRASNSNQIISSETKKTIRKEKNKNDQIKQNIYNSKIDKSKKNKPETKVDETIKRDIQRNSNNILTKQKLNEMKNPIPKELPIKENNNSTNDFSPQKYEEIKNKENSIEKKEDINIKENNHDINKDTKDNYPSNESLNHKNISLNQIEQDKDQSKEKNIKNKNKDDDFNKEIGIRSFSSDEKEIVKPEKDKNETKTEAEQKRVVNKDQIISNKMKKPTSNMIFKCPLISIDKKNTLKNQDSLNQLENNSPKEKQKMIEASTDFTQKNHSFKIANGQENQNKDELNPIIIKNKKKNDECNEESYINHKTQTIESDKNNIDTNAEILQNKEGKPKPKINKRNLNDRIKPPTPIPKEIQIDENRSLEIVKNSSQTKNDQTKQNPDNNQTNNSTQNKLDGKLNERKMRELQINSNKENDISIKQKTNDEINDQMPKEIPIEEKRALKVEKSSQIKNDQIKQNIDNNQIDESAKNKIETKTEEIICYKENNLVFQLDQIKNNAVVVNSPEAKDDIIIPSFIEYKSKKYRVTRIGKKAFLNTSVKSVKFQEDSNISIFSEFAFTKSSVSYISIPKSLQRIENGAFVKSNNISKIEIDPSNPFFSIEENLLIYKKDYKALVLALPDINEDLTISSEIQAIRNFAFLGHKKIHILTFSPSSVIFIGRFSFNKCEMLEKIIFQQNDIIKLEQNCFSECKNLKSIEVNTKKFIIEENCFKNCISLESIIFSTMDKFEASEFSFDGCTSLKTIKINSSKIIFKDNFLNYFNSLKCIEIESQDNIEIKENTFNGCNSLEIIRIITPSTLKFNKRISNISTKLKTIDLKSSNISFCENVFMNIPSLTSLTLESGANLTIDEGFFKGCDNLANINIRSKENIKITKGIFQYSTQLKSISIEGKNVFIDKEFFNNCSSISSFSLTETEKFNFDINYLKKCPNLETIRIKINFKENLNNFIKYEFESNSFTGFNKLRNISIEGLDIVLKENCFNHCFNLSSFSILNAKNVIIQSKSFNCCQNLYSISINAFNIIEISNNSFIEMNKLENISLTFDQLKIYKLALSNFSNIKLFFLCCQKEFHIIPEIFGGCKSIQNIAFSAQSKIHLYQNSFPEIQEIESIKLEGKDINIHENCFNNIKMIPKLEISSNKTVNIGEKFNISKNIQQIIIRAISKVELSSCCFYKHEKLESVEIKGQEIIIGSSCFADCSLLSSVCFHGSNTITLNGSSFSRCTKLNDVKMNSEIEIRTGKYCFDGATNLKSIEMNSKNILIEDYCFHKCSSLQSLSIEKVDNIQICSFVFRECDSLNSIIIKAASKLEAKKYSFSHLKTIETLTLIGSEVVIDEMITRLCPKLKSPFIKATRTLFISHKAFLGHSKDFQPIIENPSNT